MIIGAKIVITSNFSSFLLGIMLSLKPTGVTFAEYRLEPDTIVGNMNFYASIEGFAESLPQSIYQSSIMLRTPYHRICK